jgi:hypothetical protein
VSSNPAIAEVDADGIITAKSEGQVTITVTSKASAAVSKSATVDVYLTSPGFTIVNGVVTAYSGPGGNLKVPSKATSVRNGTIGVLNTGVFEANTTITSIDLNNVSELGVNAFKSTTGLISVNAPNVEIMYDEVFHAASNLVTVSSPKLTRVDAHAFQSCGKLTTIDLGNVTTMNGQRNFRQCTVLDNIDLSNVTTLGNQAFNDCKALRHVDLSKVTELNGSQIFTGCSSLESVDLASFAGNIPFQMFANCTPLVSVNLPKATSIGGTDANTSSRGQVFAGCNLLPVLDLPEVTILSWRAINSEVPVVNAPKVTTLQPQALAYLPKVKYLSLPSLVEIKESQFYNNIGGASMPTELVLDLSQATGLTTVHASAFPDVEPIPGAVAPNNLGCDLTIYVATDEIKALFPSTYTKTKVIVGPPPAAAD